MASSTSYAGFPANLPVATSFQKMATALRITAASSGLPSSSKQEAPSLPNCPQKFRKKWMNPPLRTSASRSQVK